MDRKRVIGEVAARHGVRLEEDDPAFLLVTIAEIALRDAQVEFVDAVRKSIADHEAAAERLQTRLGVTLGELMRRQLIHGESPRTRFRPTMAGSVVAVGLLVGLVLFIAGFLLGGRYL
ncbi:MAG: hypothetical protein K1X67_20625 [Fimbriimonadaceae bacterium]|jgi:hypothetical protein|nr:hypothetical protein [Fimbriimonadaceae bacterium]